MVTKRKEKITLKIEYAEKNEVIQVTSTLRNLNWIKKNYTDFKVILPKSLPLEKNLLSESDLAEYIREEYDEKYYRLIEKKLHTEWSLISSSVWLILTELGLAPEKEYRVILTSYGMGGSYNYPNLVVLNSRIYTVKKLINVIIHEMVHICIEPLVIENNLDHKTKEALVDIIIKRKFPEHDNETEKDTHSFDDLFRKYFSNIS